MGDRTHVRILLAKEDLNRPAVKKVLKSFGYFDGDDWVDGDWSEEGSGACLAFEEMNYGGHYLREALRAIHISYIGWCDTGSSYGAEEFYFDSHRVGGSEEEEKDPSESCWQTGHNGSGYVLFATKEGKIGETDLKELEQHVQGFHRLYKKLTASPIEQIRLCGEEAKRE